MAQRRIPEHFQGGGPSVELYDARGHDGPGTPCAGDIALYLRHARRTGGPVLELGSGTGRVSHALARAGFEVVGSIVRRP